MNDDAARYARVQDLLGDALERPADERAAFLCEACAGDDALRAEVEELLALCADGGDDPLLGDSALSGHRRGLDEAVGPAATSSEPNWVPERIGDYTVVRRLGQGGMGVVYEAEQRSPHRRVAIKLMHPMLVTPERLRRFRQEGAVLGRLKHPGIAQVHEVGSFDIGRGEQPFLVMELVEGTDLRTHCDRTDLDRRTRVALLAEVADAIHFAHEQGVVHRDLKPDNVLVDSHGHPRILDFGIARVESASATLSTIVTEEGQLVGTLAYMAPEQLEPARGPVTRQVDVYALGVLGFELLVGRLPHDVADLSLSQAITLLTTRDVPRAGRLVPELRGDLETILGKALEPESSRRYATAAAFAADLRRHLDHRPIRARPPSRTYLALKFTRRHRGLVAGAVATVLTLLLGTLISLSFASDAAEQRDIARMNERNALNGTLQSAQVLLDAGQELRAVQLLETVPRERRGLAWRLVDRAAPQLLLLPNSRWVFRDDTHLVGFQIHSENLAELSIDAELIEFSLETNEVTRRLFRGEQLRRILSVSPAGHVVALIGDHPSVIALLDMDRERIVSQGPTIHVREEIPNPSGIVPTMPPYPLSGHDRTPEFSDDGRTLLCYPNAERAEVRVDGEVVQVVDDLRVLESVHLSRDGNAFAVNRRDEVTVRDVHGGALRFQYPLSSPMSASAYPVTDGVLLASGCKGAAWINPLMWRRLPLGEPGEPFRPTDPFAGMNAAFPFPEWPSIAWPRDGSFIVATGAWQEGRAYVMDTETGAAVPGRHMQAVTHDELVLPVRGRGDPLFDVAPDGSRLLLTTPSEFQEIIELDPHEDDPAFDPRGLVLRGHQDANGNVVEGWIYHLAISADGSLIASSAPRDPFVRVWDTRTGEQLAALDRRVDGSAWGSLASWASLMAFDASGDRLLLSTPWRDRGLCVVDWDLATGHVELPVADRPQLTPHVALLDDFLVALGPRDDARISQRVQLRDGRALVTHVAHGVDIPRPERPRSGSRWSYAHDLDDPIPGLALHPDGSRVALVRQVFPGIRRTGSLLEIDADTGRVMFERELPYKPWCVVYSPDGSSLAVGTDEGNVLIFETEASTQQLEWVAHDSPGYNYVYSIAWTPDGTRLVTASGDATLRVWDTRTRVAARLEDEAWRALRASMAARDDLAEVYATLTGEERAAARAELMTRRGR